MTWNSSGTSTFIKWKRARTSCCWVFYKTLEENGRWWSKSSSSGTYRSDSATYCFKHEISFATIIQSGYEAFSLEKEHGVPVKMLQAHIARAKKTRDDLLDESQKRPRIMLDEQSEYETIKGKWRMQIEVSMDSSQYRTWKGLGKTKEECKDCKLNIRVWKGSYPRQTSK